VSKGGRPPKYRAEFAERAKEFLSQGKSITQLARELGVARQTIYAWGEDHSEFSDALGLGRDFSQAHWEDQLESMMYDKSVNAPLVKLYFANRFNWRDQPSEQESEAPPVDPVFEVKDAKAEVRTTNAKP